MAIALGGYVLALAATAPAALIEVPAGIVLAGTIWHGEAILPGGFTARWRVAPWRSLASLSASVDLLLVGPDTDLSGSASVRFGSLALDGVVGRTSTSLVHAMAPNASRDLACDAEARIDIKRFERGREGFVADGTVRTALARCPRLGPEVAVPPLLVTVSAARGVLNATLSHAADPAVPLGEASLDASGHLKLAVLPTASSVIPGLPKTVAGPFELEAVIKLP